MLSLNEMADVVLMDPYQMQKTESNLDNLTRALTGRSSRFSGATDDQLWAPGTEKAADPEQLRRSIQRDTALLEAHDARRWREKLPAYELNKAYRALQDDIAFIRQGMPNDTQMREATARNVDLLIAWDARAKKRVRAFQRTMRLLDPENADPNFLNVWRFQPDEPAKVDWTSFRHGFDEIAWQAKMDETFEPVDDDRFRRFCELKALDWSDKGIQRELGFSEAQFTEAKQRLQALRDRYAAPPEDEEDEADADAPVAPTPESTLFGALGVDPPDTTSLDDPPDDWKAFGPWVRARIKARRLVQAAVARQAKVQPTYFHNWLRGTSKMPDDVRRKVLAYLAAFDANPDAYHGDLAKES